MRRRRGRRRMKAFFIILAFIILGIAVSGNNQGDEIKYKEVFVAPNDTLWSIAQRNAKPDTNILRYIEQIKEFNGLKGSNLYAYTVIKVPEYK